MTDVSDLRRRLGELADETPEVSPKQWLAATRHRIRVHHRVRVTGAVGAVALLLAVGPTVVPPMMHSFALKPAEHAPSQVRHWEFVEGAPTHLVLGSRLNQPGASELTWTTVIPHGHPRWWCRACSSAICRRPGSPAVPRFTPSRTSMVNVCGRPPAGTGLDTPQ